MATATVKLLTAEEFSRLPNSGDGSRQELVRGEVITLSLPRPIHGRTQSKISYLLERFLEQHPIGQTTSGSGILTESDPDTVRGPDVAYWSIKRLPLNAVTEVYTDIAPDLAIEILSPSNTPRRIQGKIKEYFKHGVRMVWVVDPDFRTVTVYRKPGKGEALWEDETIAVDDVLPGFSCRVADFFPPASSDEAN